MEKLLFVDCCIRRDLSRTRVLADYFLEQVKKSGRYEVETICLMDEPLTYFSEGFFRQREELIAQGRLDHPRFRYAHQFARADKIVIAAPLWDLSIPALLKVYIENLCVDGITFGVGTQGLEGRCKADRLVFVTTRGTFYEGTPMEQGSRYMEALSRFWGIDRYDCIYAEGMDLGLEPEQALLDKGRRLADQVAAQF